MMDYGFGTGWLWMIASLVGVLLLAGLGIWAFMAALNSSNRRNTASSGSVGVAQTQTPEEILRERFARGEISPEQYKEMRHTLLGS